MRAGHNPWGPLVGPFGLLHPPLGGSPSSGVLGGHTVQIMR